jgi:8-oxo-dGTP diphosphatase
MVKTVTAALLFDQGRLMICQRPPSDHLAGLWELPGGKVEELESQEACLKRELREELGIDTVIGKQFGRSVYAYEKGTILLVAYYVQWSGGSLAPTFHSDVRFVSADALRTFHFAPADVPLIARILREWPDHGTA